MAKPFARSFYSSKMWQDCRNEYAKSAQHLCENCLRQGIYKPGEIVHHKIEISPMNINNPEVTLNFQNLELLCRDCHRKQHEHSGIGWKKYNEERKKKRQAKMRYEIDKFGRVSGKNV